MIMLTSDFHEILIHDLEDEELPFIDVSELGCLRLDWPKTLFTFMSRYQFDLDQMRKECRERFGSTQSGTCTTCGKHIQQNMGRHVALYHMEPAQLWRCPVTWCTVWKGTAQDCVDHMRRAHDIPPLVKAANLARWFPPWTVTREQWSSMSRPAVSGIAVDTLLFSRIGVPLFHRYRVFGCPGTHGAFRGTYMQQMHIFLKESDAASLRRRHRRCARDIAAQMSRTSLRDTEYRTPDVSSRPSVSCRSGSRVRRSTKSAAVSCSSAATGTVCPHRLEGSTIRALMDLALPKFANLGDRPMQPHQPWVVTTDSPASPAPVCSTDLFRSPSPLLDLDALSSDEDKESAGLSDISLAPICGSDDCHTPVNSDQVLSDEDLPAAAGTGDRRQVIRICDVPPDVQIVDISQVGRDWDSRWASRRPPVSHWWSEQTIYRRWDCWRPSNSLHLLIQGSCPLLRLRRLPLRIWRTHRCRCRPIVSRRGNRRMFPRKVVCLTCRQLRQDFRFCVRRGPLCSNQGPGCRCWWPWIVLVTLCSVI